MPIARRQFLKGGLAIAALGATMPSVLVRTLYAAAPDAPTAAQTAPDVPTEAQSAALLAPDPARRGRTLVVVQLGGGNDGLNTLAPYLDGRYHDLRPRLALDGESGVIPVGEGIGLHPALAPLEARWDAGQLAIVQNVGYPAPNRSHFRSMEIWHTGQPSESLSDGWLGRYLDESAAQTGNLWRAVSIGSTQELAFAGDTFVPAMDRIEAYRLQSDPRYPRDAAPRLVAWQALHAAAGARTGSLPLLSRTGLEAFASAETLQTATEAYEPLVDYPQGSPLAAGLRAVAQIIDAGLGTTIAYVTVSGFDTHAVQDTDHPRLLGQTAEALRAFLDDVELHGYGSDVAVMTFSEFGRRVKENGSGGTDHGTAGPVFLLGAPVRGGLYGEPPDLSQLDDGDLRYSTDFRSVYATVLEDWLRTDSQPVLLDRFDTLPLLAT